MQAIVDSYQDDRNLPRRVDQLRLACILDELSEKFFPFECKCVNLNATMWESQIERFNPHLLFVESVWNGYQKTWYGKVASRVSNELVQVVNWCKARKIPTVFWNKEDPIHTFTFLGAAFLFDFIFTTDMDCIPLYKRLLGHNRVGVLPFATSIQLFTPIDTYDRKDAACFAGSYYGKFKDRSSDLDAMFETLIGNYSLDIYDRNPYPNDPARNFPERFRSHIIGTLSPDEIEIAYKSYKLGITLNIVKNSSTMEARRIFELLSSNTFTASNSCRGIKNLFGDLVLYYENPDQFIQKIKTILSDRDTYERLCLLGLRKVIQQHTYKERLEYLFTRVFNANPDVTSPKIAVFSIVKTKQDLTWVKAAYLRQNHTHKQLLLFSDSTEISSLNGETEIHSTNLIHQVLAGDFDYYAYFSPRNYYGKNYLLDLALSTRYATVSAIGKSAFFANKDEKLQYQEGLGSYRLIDRLQIDRAMFAAHLLKSITPLSITSDSWLENLPCLSIDAYKYC